MTSLGTYAAEVIALAREWILEAAVSTTRVGRRFRDTNQVCEIDVRLSSKCTKMQARRKAPEDILTVVCQQIWIADTLRLRLGLQKLWFRAYRNYRRAYHLTLDCIRHLMNNTVGKSLRNLQSLGYWLSLKEVLPSLRVIPHISFDVAIGFTERMPFKLA